MPDDLNLPKEPTAEPSVALQPPMSKLVGQPPSQPIEPAEITHCPHCRNRLLTHRSVLCNWCGKPINDKNYLQKAAAERAAVDAAMRERLAREAERPKKLGLIGRLTKKANQLLQNDDL